jgi:metallo-beta-lactamase family protein
VLNSFSGHADRNELISYIRRFDTRHLKHIFLVHGDPDQAEKLSSGLREEGFRDISIPARGEKTTLGPTNGSHSPLYIPR